MSDLIIVEMIQLTLWQVEQCSLLEMNSFALLKLELFVIPWYPLLSAFYSILCKSQLNFGSSWGMCRLFVVN